MPILVLSGPSGVGKTTIAQQLNQQNENKLLNHQNESHTTYDTPKLRDLSFNRIITYTTRPPRKNEIHNIDYHFINEDIFSQMIENNDFVEYNKFNNHFYGTTFNSLGEYLQTPQYCIIVIEYNGYKKIKQYAHKNNTVNSLNSILLLPPSKSILSSRLEQRQILSLEPERVINYDILSHWQEYDLCIINNDINNTLLTIQNFLVLQHNNEFNKHNHEYCRKDKTNLDKIKQINNIDIEQFLTEFFKQ